MRGTIDIDIYRAKAREAAEADLREAASLDIRDWFRFEIGPPAAMSDGASGVRLSVDAHIGATRWQSFRVDLVGADVRMTGQPEHVPSLAVVGIPEVEQQGYLVYPLVDHIADKIAAMLERYAGGTMPSTRFKDLVDLVALVTEVTVQAEPQTAALRSELDRRGMSPHPTHFRVPDLGLWEPGYASAARKSLLVFGRSLEEALATVVPFVDPLLAGTASGGWDPKAGAWRGGR